MSTSWWHGTGHLSNNDRTLETVRPEDWRLGYQKRPELRCQAMSGADPTCQANAAIVGTTSMLLINVNQAFQSW